MTLWMTYNCIRTNHSFTTIVEQHYLQEK